MIIVTGVSGSGKSTVGIALAKALGWPFQEGDDLHPRHNVEKMRRGVPLDDVDRRPWLARVGEWIDGRLVHGGQGVVSCSALKRVYRDRLVRARPQVCVVQLRGSRRLLARRLARRKGHFMPASLLDSQLATLEPATAGEQAIVVTINVGHVDDAVARIVARLR